MSTGLGPSSIINLKELSQSFQPLLLCEFMFVDGSVYRASTHNLSSVYLGPKFSGVDWDPRIVDQKIAATQAMSDIGVDIPPNATIVLADPDRTLQKTWEFPKGFKGAILTIFAIMYDVGNTIGGGSFSNDGRSFVKFIGTCDTPSWNPSTMSVTARSLLNVTQTMMPPERVQQLCNNTFPPDFPSRQSGLSDPSSQFFACGYSPDIAGGVGNFSTGTASFTSCAYVRSDCQARLGNAFDPTKFQLDFDHSHRTTGRFAGFTWVPNSSSGLQRSYLTGKWDEIINASTTGKYGDYVPMCYGKTWISPIVVGVFGDGNYSNFEVLVSGTPITAINQVLVNGYIISKLAGSYARDIASPVTVNTFKNGFWAPINNGNRSGISDGLPGWGNQGDPYGNYTVIYISVLNAVAAANSIPDIQILVDGAQVRIYGAVDSFFSAFTTNPVWILMDLLTWAGWRYQDFKIAAWMAAAAVCDQQIFFNSMSGFYQNYYNEPGYPPVKRYSVGFSLRQRSAFGEILRGLRSAMKAILYFDYFTGELVPVIKQTLAAQQPGPIPGSNYTTPLSSVLADGTSANGYVAYYFNRSNIKKVNGVSSLKISSLQYTQAPNKISQLFQNRENEFNQDSMTVIDTEDTTRMGGYPIGGTLPLLGAQTFDAVGRVVNGYFAECFRGNTRLNYQGSAIGDTGGTMIFDFDTTVKGIHLTIGQICIITDEQSQGEIFMLPVRITRIQPSMNFEETHVTATVHNDTWYQDGFGQTNAPTYNTSLTIPDRVPFAWQPGVLQANDSDIYYADGRTFFNVYPLYQLVVGNQISAFVRISGIPPVNKFNPALQRPQLAQLGSSVTTSGSWSAGGYFMSLGQISASVGNPQLTVGPISRAVPAALPSPGTLEVNVQNWSFGSIGYVTCVGQDPSDMYWANSTASVVYNVPSLTSPVAIPSFQSLLHCPPPDEVFSNFRWRIQQELWPGVASGMITSISYASGGVGNTVLSMNFPAGESWSGRELSVVGLAPANIDTYEATFNQPPWIPVCNLHIQSGGGSSSMTLTGNVGSQAPNISIGDMVVARMSPSFGSDSIGFYFQDSGVVTPVNPNGFGGGLLVGCEIFVIAGTGLGISATIISNTNTRCYVANWGFTPDSSTRLVILKPTLEIDQSTSPVVNSVLNIAQVGSLPIFSVDVTTLQHKMLFIQAFTEGVGRLSSSVFSPFREVYLFDGSVDDVLINGVGGPGNLG